MSNIFVYALFVICAISMVYGNTEFALSEDGKLCIPPTCTDAWLNAYYPENHKFWGSYRPMCSDLNENGFTREEYPMLFNFCGSTNFRLMRKNLSTNEIYSKYEMVYVDTEQLVRNEYGYPKFFMRGRDHPEFPYVLTLTDSISLESFDVYLSNDEFNNIREYLGPLDGKNWQKFEHELFYPPIQCWDITK